MGVQEAGRRPSGAANLTRYFRGEAWKCPGLQEAPWAPGRLAMADFSQPWALYCRVSHWPWCPAQGWATWDSYSSSWNLAECGASGIRRPILLGSGLLGFTSPHPGSPNRKSAAKGRWAFAVGQQPGLAPCLLCCPALLIAMLSGRPVAPGRCHGVGEVLPLWVGGGALMNGSLKSHCCHIPRCLGHLSNNVCHSCNPASPHPGCWEGPCDTGSTL